MIITVLQCSPQRCLRVVGAMLVLQQSSSTPWVVFPAVQLPEHLTPTNHTHRPPGLSLSCHIQHCWHTTPHIIGNCVYNLVSQSYDWCKKLSILNQSLDWPLTTEQLKNYSCAMVPQAPWRLVIMLSTLSRCLTAMTWSRRRAAVIKWSHNLSSSFRSTVIWAQRPWMHTTLDWLSSVLRPRQHSIGYMGDGDTHTNSCYWSTLTKYCAVPKVTWSWSYL